MSGTTNLPLKSSVIKVSNHILVAFCELIALNGHMISSHIDHRPLHRIKLKSYHGRVCDIGKYRIVIQRIDIILYQDETCNLHR